MSRPTHEPPKPLPGWVIWLFLVVGFVGGLGLVYVAVVELVHDDSLGEGAVTTRARVVDVRIMTSSKRGDSYELRYAFEVGGATYSYRDATGRTDLWATLEHPAWEDARRHGEVEVAYLPADPWTNRAVHEAGSPVGDHLAGLCMGLLCMAPLIAAAVGALRRRGGGTAVGPST